jgi:hypothetical protein
MYVEFTLVAENPFLYGPLVTVLEEEVVGDDLPCVDPEDFFLTGPRGAAHCADVEPPAVGVLGSIITITAPSGVGGLECGYFTTGCPPADGDEPSKAIYVERLEPGQTLIIDSAHRKITLSQVIPAVIGSLCGGGPCPDTITQSDGTGALYFPEGTGIEWLEVAACDDPDGCFCVRTTNPCSGGGDATVKIETQLRVG